MVTTRSKVRQDEGKAPWYEEMVTIDRRMRPEGFRKWLPRSAGLALVTASTAFAFVWMASSNCDFELKYAVGENRCIAILASIALLYVRLVLMVVVIIQRDIPWEEVQAMALVAAIIALCGYWAPATQVPYPQWLDAVAWLCVIGGALLTTGGELHRFVWKKDPRHKGKLFTLGVFRWAQRANYTGEILTYSGMAILLRSLVLGMVPPLMLLMFVYAHGPALERYLADRYKGQYEAYVKQTPWKYVPYVY